MMKFMLAYHVLDFKATHRYRSPIKEYYYMFELFQHELGIYNKSIVDKEPF